MRDPTFAYFSRTGEPIGEPVAGSFADRLLVDGEPLGPLGATHLNVCA